MVKLEDATLKDLQVDAYLATKIVRAGQAAAKHLAVLETEMAKRENEEPAQDGEDNTPPQP